MNWRSVCRIDHPVYTRPFRGIYSPIQIAAKPDKKSTGSTGSRRRRRSLQGGGLTSAIPINRSRSVHAIPHRRLNLLIHPQGPSVTCSLPYVYFFSTPAVGQIVRSQNSLSPRSNNHEFYRSNSRPSDSRQRERDVFQRLTRQSGFF